jgi:hypothetical protein
MMETKVSNDDLEHVLDSEAEANFPINEKWHKVRLSDVATELLDLRRDAADSQNHNSGVIDRIYLQLQDAGFHGTLSEMVEQAINPWISVEDRLPEYTEDYNVICHILTHHGNFRDVKTYRFENIQGREPKWCIPNDDEVVTISHWMPLPLPPSEEG